MEATIAAGTETDVMLLGFPGLRMICRAGLAGADALCMGGRFVYAACGAERAVYRLCRWTLLPDGVMTGGPGVRAMRLSADGERLYMLCADADGVLLLGAAAGEMRIFARVGVNPQAMSLTPAQDALLIAGGADGCVHLLGADDLNERARVHAGGWCFGAAACGRYIHALSADGQSQVCLHSFCGGSCTGVRRLGGLPCAVAPIGDRLAVCHGGGLSLLTGDARAVLVSRPDLDAAGTVLCAGGQLLLHDEAAQSLRAADADGAIIARAEGIVCAAAD